MIETGVGLCANSFYLYQMKKTALIVAGGTGSRMGADIPKQFLLLSGLPVLMHTINAFASMPEIQIVLVLPENQIKEWHALCDKFAFSVPHKIVVGGPSRFHSVRNGLGVVDSEGIVAIHDGARPLVSEALIKKTFVEAQQYGSAVAAIALTDSIREQTLTGETRNVNRKNYYLIQTPQTFKVSLIKEAYNQATHENFTDDAGVAEEAGIPIRLVEGSSKNIKITTPDDLLVAALYLDA